MLRGIGSIALFLAVGPVCAAPGDLDPTFGSTGIVVTSLASGSDEILAAALQRDGKLVCAGYANLSPAQFAVARFNLDGSPDATFSGDGKVFTAVTGGRSYGEAVAIQPDGKIVVAGYGHTGANYDFAIARYNADGILDPSFGVGGIVVIPVGTGNDQCFGMALQPDGRIVLSGTSGLVRCMPDGSLDNSFGSGGKVVFPIGTTPGVGGKIVLQPDGRIVAANYIGTGSNNYDFVVGRYNTNGTFDATFGSGGRVITPFSAGIDYAFSVALQPDQKILVAGKVATGTNDDFAVARYNSNGSLDTSFDGDGKLTFPIGGSNETARCVAVQGDGKVVLAGYAFIGGSYDFAVARRNADGSADGSFQGGVVTTPIGASSDFGDVSLIQCDGKIVVAGDTFNGSGYDFVVARYESGWMPPPDISVELPAGGTLTSGNHAELGFATVGTNACCTLIVRNSGGTNLSALVGQIDGANAADFTVLQSPETNLAPYQAATWSVIFAPTTPGDKTATLHIESNDPDEDPFDVELRGTGITHLEAWRLRYFGCITNQGMGADMHDCEPDGAPNLLEFATDGHPQQYGSIPVALMAPSGGSFSFVYSRNKAAVGELTFIVEWSDTLLPDDWHSEGVVENVLPGGDAATDLVQATIPSGPGPARFVRLRVTRP